MAGSCTTTKKVWHEVGKTWFIVDEDPITALNSVDLE